MSQLTTPGSTRRTHADATTAGTTPAGSAQSPPAEPPSHRGRFLTSRRGAWIVLAIALAICAVVLGPLRATEAPPRGDSVPASAESAVAAQVGETFPGSDVAPVLVVLDRGGDPLEQADLDAAAEMGEALAALTGHAVSPVIPAEDGAAAMLSVPITLGADNSATADVVDDVRATVAEHTAQGLTAQVTGGPAFGADIASSFDGADITLLLVTIAIVAVLLIGTYRSPVLFLVPLLVVGVADQVASILTKWLGTTFDLQFDGGIISVLVFGAGTNYALLLISRYREELRRHESHRTALAAAWRGAVPAIVASNITVVLALLTLALATLPGTRGLGIASAAGLVVALAAAVIVLPAALAVCGRKIFWPFVPRAGQPDPQETGIWSRIARFVVGRPTQVVVSAVLALGILASGLLGTQIGLTQTEKFRVASESAAGLEVLAEHYPAGEAAPLQVYAEASEADQVASELESVEGIVRVQPTQTDEWTRFTVIGEAAPGTPEAENLVTTIRDAVTDPDVPAADRTVLVGGANAQDLDEAAAADRDFLVVAPLVLLVALIVLIVLLRSVLAPVLLLVVNVVSSAAAIGAGTWLGRALFGFPALDVMVPLLAFLFLVALGIDYTIFLVHRARHEAVAHGTREGMVRAVAHTGAVITSAGIVLAGVFAALGVLPLVTLGQLGLIVGVGVLLDTLLVRAVLVPAIFALVGDRIWWPSAPAASAPVDATVGAAQVEDAAHSGRGDS
ncbi:MMPL family transporter [Ornithinimicrobium faecis]|uniref:MMPL family transporter n=1 Tax=Ornithinimicrobium faecis TaxID=2934158 RepID=A0ABY4YSL9_9MICO|nr:MMPL family transporter [Ornithinimicrobium sp. HY1793]USQ79762.1 MMPL family transporter [Ornithinimicrobium sp. HY1793]